MNEENSNLVPVFIPSLSAVLLSAEDKKGSPLTYDEVIQIRDKSACIMMKLDDARKLDESRGYRDIDPENCWHDWQNLRREMGRKPDLDTGPKFHQIKSSDPEYQKTIKDAQESLHQFRDMLPKDGSPTFNAMVKTKLTQGSEDHAFMWLSNTRLSGSNFIAELFEVPKGFSDYREGEQIEVHEKDVMDWWFIDNGVLFGGFSIRYHRSKLPEEERDSYDKYIGVKDYA